MPLSEHQGEQATKGGLKPKNSAKLDSDALSRLQRFKRQLVLELFMKQGPFWETIEELRKRWGIEAVTQVPSPDFNLPYSCDYFQNPGDYWEWDKCICSLLEDTVPERFYRYFGEDEWETFLSACVHYDPPETNLLAFATFEDPSPICVIPEDTHPGFDTASLSEDYDVESLPTMVAPPIQMLRDPRVSHDLEKTFWLYVIQELTKRYLKPLGLDDSDVAPMVGRILADAPKELYEYVVCGEKKREKLRPYIAVDEYTTEEDVRRAFRMIRATQGGPSRSRHKRDPLISVECAILHDRHGWTYEQLAHRHDWKDPSRAGKYIKVGRNVLTVVG
jgi:hypothetical protein